MDASLGVTLSTDRTQNPAYNVCPQTPVTSDGSVLDQYGRPVHYSTTNRLTAGCHTPAVRVGIENKQRPEYFAHLGTRANQSLGSAPEPPQKFAQISPGYDTAALNRDQSFGHHGKMYVAPGKDFYTEQQRIDRVMSRKYSQVVITANRGY